MRVVVLSQCYAPEVGAPQTRLAAFAREMRRCGHEVEVVTAMPHHSIGRVYDGYRGKAYMREVIDGVTVHRTWVYAATGTGIRRIINYLSFTASSLFGLMRAKRADLVFVESPPLFLSVPGWIAARLWRARMVFNVADLWPDSVRELGVMRDGWVMRTAEALERWSYRHADIVNAVTQGIKRDLHVRKHVPEAKLRFFPNGIDVDRFYPRERNRELQNRLQLDERPLFLYAGQHGIAQGLQFVVEAAKLLEGEANLLMVGSGPMKPMLIELVRRINATNVHFRDPVPLDAMPDYFSLAVASIVPLVDVPLMRNARPSKIFPSLASGVPVIYCGRGESAELLESAGAGISVPPENAQALADAMRALANDVSRQRSMAQRGRELTVNQYTWSAIVPTWLRSIEPLFPKNVNARAAVPETLVASSNSARTSLTSSEPNRR